MTSRDIHTASPFNNPALYKPSNPYGIYSLLKNLIPLGLIYALAPLLAKVSPLLAWLLMPVVGLLIYRLTMVMHDCGHLTLYSSRRANLWTGRFLGFLTGIDFYCFRNRHWAHHKSYGEPQDPQGFHYNGIVSKSQPEFFWHLVRPLLGCNLKYAITESILAPKNLRKSVQNGDVVFIMLLHLLILGVITNFGQHIHLALLPVVSAGTFGLFLSQLRGIAEHGSRDGPGQRKLVRSHAAEVLGKLFLYDMNFNYHKEHHDHPGIPGCKLPLVHACNASQVEVRITMWQTLARIMCPQRLTKNG